MTGTNGGPVFVYIVKFSGTENSSTKRNGMDMRMSEGEQRIIR